jgi:pantothenate kinase
MNSLLKNYSKFFWQEIDQEAFTHNCGKKTFINIDQFDLFPYLLVNIGSGVSIIKVISIAFSLNLLSLFNFLLHSRMRFYIIHKC